MDASDHDVELRAKINECFNENKINVKIIAGGRLTLFMEVVLLKTVKKDE